MTIEELNGKSICILGYGREGQAMVKALEKFAPDATIEIRDQKNGPDYLDNLDQFDVLIKSPGIPPHELTIPPRARASEPRADSRPHESRLTNSTQIFLDTVKEAGSLVIGVTGTKGKSTTASLIYAILNAAGKDVHLVGNIGDPAIDHLAEAKKDTIFVMEMSSYQLMDIKDSSPQIAVITSLFPDHLDYHGGFEAYKEAKTHITANQTADDVVFYSADSEGAKRIVEASPGAKIPYKANDAPVAVADTELKGAHNLSNIAGAWKVCEHLGVDQATASKAIQEFKGLPHRMQSLGIHDDIEWIDDAISTTPESTIAAIETFKDRLGAIILGGQDRGYHFGELAEAIKDIPTIILFPESGTKIKEALFTINRTENIFEVSSMQQAIERTKNQKLTNQKPICLLSPASPSYNQYKNFEEKGEDFKRCIEN